MLQRVDRDDLFLLMAEQVLFMPLHFFILDLHDLLVRLLSLEIETGLFTFFAVILEQLQKLDHIVIGRIPSYRERYLCMPAWS